MLDNNFKIKLEMLSDWQIGTGAGIPGSTDELISKDVDGFPQVPAKTLIGIWRDALERLCDGLGGNWSEWVEVIFGVQPNLIKSEELKKRLENNEKTYSNAILSIQPARISENLRTKIGEDKRLKQALTFTKVGVKIDPDSGTSETEALRFEEMGRIGSVLGADVECEKMNETISALLILSAKLVERIGGKRRRGAGKCKLEIVGITDKEIEEAVKTISDNKTSADKKIEIQKTEFTQNASDWQTCEYTLTLETPVSIVTAVLGNVSETLDFIPGTYLISHFVKHFKQDIFDEIQKNNFQISPATICIDGNRSFPVPKVFFAQEKMKKPDADKPEVYNRLLEPLEGKEQTKPIREGYISDLDSNSVSYATTPQTILMHNAVDDEVQRPTTDVVGIYSRAAINAGTVLKGEIRFRNLNIEDFSKLNGKVRIGTSKKDGGLATIEVTKKENNENKKKEENENDQRKPDNELIVYLASDVMIRNGNLRQTNLVEDLKTELEKTFGNGTLKSYDELLAEAKKKLGENENDEDAKDFIKKRKDVISSIIQVRRIESWQVGWGFPRPTLTLMQAGSVVVFETKDKIDLVKFQAIEQNGIGERRGEGYGQVIFNPQVLKNAQPDWQTIKKKDFKERNVKEIKQKTEAELKAEKEEVDRKFSQEISNDENLKEFAELIEETAWREEIKLAVSKIAVREDLRKNIFGFEIEEKDNSKKSIPPMAQIGGLRSAIARLQNRTDEEKTKTRKIITDWLQHLRKTKNRFDKWGDERIGKIESLITKDNEVWQVLEKKEIVTGNDKVKVWKSPETLVRNKDELQKKLWAEAVKSLFYACQHAHKRGTEDKNNGEKN